MNTSGETKPAKLNRVLHLLSFEHCSRYVSSLCDDGHTVDLSKMNSVVKKNESEIAVVERTGNMYLVMLRDAGEKEAIAFEVSAKMLRV